MSVLKITITGGSGFIGTYLSESLKNHHEVKILDVNPPKTKNVEFNKCDLSNDNQISEIIKGSEIVIHLAAAVGVKMTEEEPIKTLDLNILGTRKILDACKENKIKKIIFSSSSEVYGEPHKVPINENEPAMPITNYGVSKIAGEEYVKAYSKKYDFKYSILRFFNAYGSKQSKSFVIPEFVNNAILDKPIIIHGSGKQIRAFCHINDIVNGINLSIEKGNNDLFNIGNNLEPITILDLAKKIISITKSKSEIKFVPFEDSNRQRSREIINRIPDISKAKKILEFEPSISLNEGIKLFSSVK
jgi:UDP-glucose 4-epimerase